jgi:hypothetical protein
MCITKEIWREKAEGSVALDDLGLFIQSFGYMTFL